MSFHFRVTKSLLTGHLFLTQVIKPQKLSVDGSYRSNDYTAKMKTSYLSTVSALAGVLLSFENLYTSNAVATHGKETLFQKL